MGSRESRAEKPMEDEADLVLVHDLVVRYQAGDRRAGDRLLAIHDRAIFQFVIRAKRRGVDADDLMQEARAGFLQAAQRFDPARGFRLLTLAKCWIRPAVRRAERDANVIRVPRARANRREATTLAAHAALRAIVSLDDPHASHGLRRAHQDDEEAALLARIASDEDDPEETYARVELEVRARREAAELLKTLTPRERFILEARICCADDPTTLEDLGLRYGVTRERVRQIEAEALAKLQRAAYARGYARGLAAKSAA